MHPDRVSNYLRQIATKIDNSKQPKCQLVAADIRTIISALTGQYTFNANLFKNADDAFMDEDYAEGFNALDYGFRELGEGLAKIAKDADDDTKGDLEKLSQVMDESAKLVGGIALKHGYGG